MSRTQVCFFDRSTQKPTENATDILKPPSPSHRTSDLSQFDTPQDEATHFDTLQEGDNFVTDVDHDNGKIDLKKDQIEDKKPTRMKPSDATGIFKEDKKESPSIDFDKEDEFNFNDQMIVLVEHHGSDDEVVIDVDGLEEDSSEKDEDLLDLPPFARNGSITTVGVVSEGSMAFNSVSVNPSVSSLVSSEDSDDDRGKAKNVSCDNVEMFVYSCSKRCNFYNHYYFFHRCEIGPQILTSHNTTEILERNQNLQILHLEVQYRHL